MALVRVTQVIEEHAKDAFYGAFIDRPKAGAESDTYSLPIEGWVLGRSSPVKSVEVIHNGRTLVQVPLTVHRPDVASEFPNLPDAKRSGFLAPLRGLEVGREFEVTVAARFESGDVSPLARLQGNRESLPGVKTVAIQPVILTTIGRSGSKWLAWLMSCHPAIVAFRPLDFEPRVATYWMSVLRFLARPESYFRQIHADNWNERRWWLGDGQGPLPAPLDSDLTVWLGRDAIESLASAMQARIEQFYERIRESSGKYDARYFVEKFLLDPVPLELTAELYPDAREIILVRDFRDRLSSVLAWSAERGDRGFGWDPSMSEAEYLTSIVRADAWALLHRWRERAGAAHLVRYEDLIGKPAETLADILRYLEVDASADVVQATFDRAWQETELLDTHRTVSDPTASIGRWRHDLADDVANLCSDILGPVLAEFGYPVEDHKAPARP